MSWQNVTVIGLVLATSWTAFAWHAWLARCEKERHISDNEVKMSDNRVIMTQTPRSIFGNVVPSTPAVMHHSGGVGKAVIRNPKEGVQ
jgi:hypothetical protein